jgi:hypothetical protein
MSNIDSRTKAPTHHRFKDDNDFDSIVAQDHAHFKFFRSLLDDRFHETAHGTGGSLVDSSFVVDQTRSGIMAGWRQAVELTMSDEEIASLTAVARSRSEAARRVKRAQILLSSMLASGPSKLTMKSQARFFRYAAALAVACTQLRTGRADLRFHRKHTATA